MSEEQTQDNNPETNHVKDMIDSLSQGDNIGAEKSFKDGLAGKISAALDASRPVSYTHLTLPTTD